LKTVGRRARLERASAQDLSALRGDNFGHFFNLVAAFDAARPGHDDDFAAADFDVPDLHDGARRTKPAAGEFIWRNDAVNFLHALHQLHDCRIEIFLSPDSAKNRMDHTRRTVNVESVLHQAGNDLLYLGFGSALLHYDKHCFSMRTTDLSACALL
jgi:hypothetical protein